MLTAPVDFATTFLECLPTMSNKRSPVQITHRASSITVIEKLSLIPIFLFVSLEIIVSLTIHLIRSKEIRRGKYRRIVFLTSARTLMGRISVNQGHYISPTCDKSYSVACKKRGVEEKREILEDGTVAYWIGDRQAKNVMLYVHAGGFVLPLSAASIEFMFQVIDFAKENGKNISCLILSYELAPEAVYPRQLQQSAVLLNFVINNLQKSPEDIIMVGDSAGANLILSLLSHISHPHPSTTVKIPKVELKSSLRGVVLIGPWLSYGDKWDSIQRNKYNDIVRESTAKTWSSLYLTNPWPHTNGTDFYNEPFSAPESWWENLKVKNILITAGGNELLVDEITEFHSKFKRELEGSDEKINITYEIAEGECHDQPIIDIMIGYSKNEEGKQAKDIKKWIADIF